jgi:hypothetical protein
MRYPLYVCATCSQGFTRKSSANRHNLNIHSGKGDIVRFLDYIVGRIKGLYATADPLSFRKNRGNNLRNLRPIEPDSLHPSLKNSDADSIAAAEVHDLSSNNRPFVQERNSNHYFSSPDNLIGLAIRVLEIEALYATERSMERRFQGIILPDGTYGIQIHSFLAEQFSNKYIFGYVGYVCPFCAHFAIYQLEFRNGNTENRTWFTFHECHTKTNSMGERSESTSSRYVKACDSRPSYLERFSRAWLKNNFHVFAIKLHCLCDMDRGLVEIPDPAEPSKSICIYISKDEIIDLGNNGEHWAGRAIANQNKPTPISEEEMIDFLRKTEHSTFGIFNIRSADPPGWRNEHFMINLG